MELRPEMTAIAKQFPWARMQKDGSFEFSVFLMSKDLLGTGREFGWWTMSPCCKDRSTYTWGFQLLEAQHMKEKEGWKLPDDQIPWLDFAAGGREPPQLPVDFEHTWEAYYKWRGLPMESPACLMLHWPLSVFRLLHILELVPSTPPTERRRLLIHYIGVERELDFLPL